MPDARDDSDDLIPFDAPTQTMPAVAPEAAVQREAAPTAAATTAEVAHQSAGRFPTAQFDTGVGPAGAPASSPTQVGAPVPPAPAPALGGLMPMFDDPRRRFDTVLRGYDRHQVDTYVAKLEDDVAVLSVGRSDTSTQISSLAAQLASAQAEIESLRRRVAVAGETIDPDNVDVRVQEVVALAQGVARQTRSDAEADARRVHDTAVAAADSIRVEAQTEADLVVAAATQRLAEADQTYTRKTADADRYAQETSARADQELTLARAEVGSLRSSADREIAEARTTAAAEIAAADTAASAARTEADTTSRTARENADAMAADRRRTAEEDFEITLRLRRRREEDEDRQRRTDALAEATTIVADANNAADRITRAARAEVERLDHERRRAHAELGTIAGRIGGIVTDHDPDRNPLATS